MPEKAERIIIDSEALYHGDIPLEGLEAVEDFSEGAKRVHSPFIAVGGHSDRVPPLVRGWDYVERDCPK